MSSSIHTTVKSSTTTPRPPTTSKATSSPPAPTTTPSRHKFKYFGVNQSCAEFGNMYFLGLGFNTFRISFLMKRLSAPATALTGPFDPTYLYFTSNGGYAIIDPHDFLRYNGAVITSRAAFSTWWANLATEFISNDHAVFDINNEPHAIDASIVYQITQAAVNVIRAAGATSQLILVEGTSWTGAWTTLQSVSHAPTSFFHPLNQRYLDSNGSGTNEACVSPTIGVDRITAATNRLKQNNLKGSLGLGRTTTASRLSRARSALCRSPVVLGSVLFGGPLVPGGATITKALSLGMCGHLPPLVQSTIT
ncbi:hypothetical protein FRB99_002517 [Tulasnella sp. 403]|nr:hypothetical protein FRB99_002517 [Tulasnella sp. 403]